MVGGLFLETLTAYPQNVNVVAVCDELVFKTYVGNGGTYITKEPSCSTVVYVNPGVSDGLLES